MGKYNKESLEKLLILIDEICKSEENFWFKEALVKKTLISDTKSDIVIKLRKIEKYLKIDGLEIIDYSEISNENVRRQLFRDSVEMSKYRLGKINDTINFSVSTDIKPKLLHCLRIHHSQSSQQKFVNSISHHHKTALASKVF